MSWRDNLQPASFRGVQFFIDTTEAAFGRRNILHEYPQRDIPYAEDLGRKAREFTVSAYVLGEEYDFQRDRLLAAIEQQSTPGTFIHPTMGALQVVPRDCRVSFSNQEGGVERFSLTFIQAGEIKYPSSGTDTGTVVSINTTSASSQLQTTFSQNFNINSQPNWISNQANTVSNALYTQLGNIPAGDQNQSVFAGLMSGFGPNIFTLLQTPSSFASSVAGLFAGITNLYSSAQTAYNVLSGFTSFGSNYTTLPGYTPTIRTYNQNQAALLQLVHESALFQMATVSTVINFDSYNDAVTFRDTLADALDNELLTLGNTNQDSLYYAIDDLRSSVITDITTRAATLVPLKTVQYGNTLPALVIAYDLYQDASRDAEIVARNKIINPCFVPGGYPLQVLAS